MNSRQTRIIRRRSPPRIVTLDGGLGGNHPLQVRSSVKIPPQSVNETKSLIPKLQEIVSLSHIQTPQTSSSKLTSVIDYPNQQDLPRVGVTRHPTTNLQLIEKKGSKSVQAKPKSINLPAFGSGYKNRIERNSRTKAIINGGAAIESGTRQVWALPESYRHEVYPNQPSLLISGNQGIRITFHRDAGSILQDLEIPPSDGELEIGVPEGTRMFSIQGMGGHDSIDPSIEPSSGSISEMYPNGMMSCIGFQRLTTVHQIGYFRYLSRGMFIQARESPSRKVMDNTSLFNAGEVLSKIDNIRVYSSSQIRTFVVILRTLANCQPHIKVAMEGVELDEEPNVIERSDGYAYVWSVKSEEGFLGPAIIDIETDESTDVNSVLAYRASRDQVLGVLRSSMWTKLIPSSTLSSNGLSSVRWIHHSEPKTTNDNVIVPKNWTMTRTSQVQRVRKPLPKPQPLPVSRKPEETRFIQPALPEIEASSAQANQVYSFDLSQFAADEDEDDTMTFENISSPEWVSVSQNGMISGTPSHQDEGRNEIHVRVSDAAGLSSDALVIIPVEVKTLNRAPYWKPNITKKVDNIEDIEKKSKQHATDDVNHGTKRRRRR